MTVTTLIKLYHNRHHRENFNYLLVTVPEYHLFILLPVASGTDTQRAVPK